MHRGICASWKLALSLGLFALPVSAFAQAWGEPYLLLDLRVSGTGAKTATVQSLGDTVLLDLYARIVGSPMPSEGFGVQSGMGSFLSSQGGLLGELIGLSPPQPFNGSGAVPGLSNDLDSDGDADIGGTDPEQADGFYAFRSSTIREIADQGVPVGRLRFTATSFQGGSTEIRYVPRAHETGALFMLNGGTQNGLSQYLQVGAPVTVRFDGTVVDPGELKFLSGTIDEHVKVMGSVRASPGTTLIFNGGVDIAPTGDLDLREAGAYGPHEIRINDHYSGNAGGTLYAGRMVVGSSSEATFVQSAGFARIGTSLEIGDAPGKSATFRMSGGALRAQDLTIGVRGSGALEQFGGDIVVDSLRMRSSTGGTARIGGEGQFTVTGDVRIGGTANIFRQEGGTSNFTGKVYVGGGPSSRFEIAGGRLTAQFFVIGDDGSGLVRQSGGEATISNMTVGAAVGRKPEDAMYQIDSGNLTLSSVSIGSRLYPLSSCGGVFIQNGGSVAVLGSLNFASSGAASRYELNGGNLSVNREFLTDTSSKSPVTARFRQVSGEHTVNSLHIGGAGRFEYWGGRLRVLQELQLAGEFNFYDPVTLEIGDGAFADFSNGQINGEREASIIAGESSFMQFRPGFDPYVRFASIQTRGIIHIAGQPVSIRSSETVQGTGTITGDVANEGVVSPGRLPGTLTIEGEYTQLDSGTLLTQLAGTSEDTFDILKVKHHASLAGTLEVSLLGDFVPSPNDSFVILRADGGIDGRFNYPNDTVTFPGGSFHILYDDRAVTLTGFVPAVPEPSGTLILAAGAIAAARRRRRIVI